MKHKSTTQLPRASLSVGLLLGLCALSIGILAAAEHDSVTLDMSDGTQIVAPYIRSTRQTVTIALNGVEKVIPMTEVRRMNFNPTPAANAVADPVPAATPNPLDPAAIAAANVDPAAAPKDPTIPAPAATGEPATDVPVAPADPATPATARSIEVMLPTLEAGRLQRVSIPLQWTIGLPAPWYAINRASSLHQMPAWSRTEPTRETMILADIAALGDLSKVPVAYAELKGIPAEAAPYLVIFLFDSNPARAEQCANLLLERGDRDVTKYFIEALYAVSDKDGAALSEWLQPYAKKLLAGANRFTGLEIKSDPAATGFSADAFIACWNKSLDDDPVSLGEPPYKPEAPPANADIQQEAWIVHFRTLALKRATFTRPEELKMDLTRKYPTAPDADADRAIRHDLDAIGSSATEKDRNTAKAALESRDWAVVAPYFADALVNRHDMTTRLVLLDIVSRHTDKAMCWAILNVLIESWGTPTSVPSANSAGAIRVCDAIMRNLTGFTAQPAVQPTFVGGYKPIRGFIDEWNHHYLEFPRQYGEPELDKTLPKYTDYMKELRFVKEQP